MRLLPVIDVLRGEVVRGVAGRRDDYRPISSRWASRTDPFSVACSLQEVFGFQRFYLADLDGILFGRANLDEYRRLTEHGFELLVDSGIRQASDAEPLFERGVSAVIAGLESLAGPSVLSQLVASYGKERIVFSLDLKSGAPLQRDASVWPVDSVAIAEVAVTNGVSRLIVLDLADVGTGRGPSTYRLCRMLLEKYPPLTVIAGGGVKERGDVEWWASSGIADLLVASALHDERLSPEFVRRFL